MKTRGVLIYCDAFQGNSKAAIENCLAAAKGISMQQKMQMKNDIPSARQELLRKKGIKLTDEEVEIFLRDGAYKIKVVVVDI